MSSDLDIPFLGLLNSVFLLTEFFLIVYHAFQSFTTKITLVFRSETYFLNFGFVFAEVFSSPSLLASAFFFDTHTYTTPPRPTHHTFTLMFARVLWM